MEYLLIFKRFKPKAFLFLYIFLLLFIYRRCQDAVRPLLRYRGYLVLAHMQLGQTPQHPRMSPKGIKLSRWKKKLFSHDDVALKLTKMFDIYCSFHKNPPDKFVSYEFFLKMSIFSMNASGVCVCVCE